MCRRRRKSGFSEASLNRSDVAVSPNDDKLDEMLRNQIAKMRRSAQSGGRHVLDVVCEKEGFSFVDAMGERRVIPYKNKQEVGGRTGQCEERSTEDDQRQCRSGEDARGDDERQNASCKEGISGRKERSAYAVGQQRPARAMCREKEQEPQVWVSGIKEQGLKSKEDFGNTKDFGEKNETVVEKRGSGSDGGEIIESISEIEDICHRPDTSR